MSNLFNEMMEEMSEKDQKITDLKAKLAESEKQANDWKQRFESSEKRCETFNSNGVTALNLKNEKIDQLKQQLADTDKLMQEYLSKCLSLEQQLAEKEKFLERIMSGEYIPANIAEKSLKLINQTAIAELEKVKDKFREIYDKNRKHHLSVVKCYELVDEQISELKGEK